MRKARIALVTASSARAHDRDMPLLSEAIGRHAGVAEIVDWDDRSVTWHRFDLVVLRSTWDYPRRREEFLAWVDHVQDAGTLVNDADVVRWNTDKEYLLDPALASCPVVRTWRLAAGDDPLAALDALREAHPGEDVVVKPSIGSGGAYASRYAPTEDRQVIAGHASSILAAGFPVLIQPYFSSVDTYGETTLIYFDGEYSHAIRKGRMLHQGCAPSARPKPPTIDPCTASPDERVVGDLALDCLPCTRPLLYARIDLVQNREGRPHVLELELTEPTLFLRHDPASADRFAARILARVERSIG